MSNQLIQPRKALNKAFLKIKPNRTAIEVFKSNLIQVLDSCNDKESEEFHKNLVSDFLKNTYYSPNHFINTKNRNDLVIHNGKDAKTTVGVIIEAKSPTNKSEMITVNNLNGKALQELVLYFLRERITHKNLEIKHLVVTNIYEWFVFDAQLFEKHFAQNKTFVKQFEEFEAKQLSGVKTDFFYKDIAKPFLETIKNEIEFTYFNFKDYDKPLRNADKEDDKSLIALFKLLSPEHLLKLSFANDSNSLDKNFYSELLHIIGLTETKEGGKKLIQRHSAANRNHGSLLENAIVQIDTLDKIARLQNPKQYGDTHEERLFNVALELTITWVNRILFLKLLEAQLISYHKGDKSYAFLNANLINDYDKLNKLFFQVLAKKPSDRIGDAVALYGKVPYLNSSLFEPTDLEHDTLFISMLEDEITLPLLASTVIKDGQGKKEKGTKNALNYFFAFLDAYDFASEGSEDIQEDNKTLINASVLGLIFEKINGYKDGSFFTPGFITMYMCKETIRRAVVQKFNETKDWHCETIIDIHNKITDTKEANAIVNAIKICDPAVGSGHFLVSALNELIVIKHDLGILQDATGKKLRDYSVEIVNDELIISDDEGIPFAYNPTNKESQRIQETLFKEKATIIENCLFGVDINPNSVKICRLRLWIELLKNAYYCLPTAPSKGGGAATLTANEGVPPSGVRGLETLPNIDINIKCGNSLISRFDLDTDLKKALKQSKWNIESYKIAVATYRNAESKEQKREMERLIADIKGNFRSEIAVNDPKKLKLEKLNGELFNYTQQVGLFERSKKEQTEWNKKVNVLSADIKTLETDIESIKSNKIYENAFEWRFEFPEVLNDDGEFVGFDVVIGNPPYGADIKNREVYKNLYPKTSFGQIDTYKFFIERGINILQKNMYFSYITSDSYLEKEYFRDLRLLITESSSEIRNIKLGDNIFDEVNLPTAIIQLKKSLINHKKFEFSDVSAIERNKIEATLGGINYVNEIPEIEKQFSISKSIINKENTKELIELFDQVMGVKVYQIGKGKPKQTDFEINNNVFISSESKGINYFPFISQGIKRYFYEEKNEFINYGEWLAEPRDIKYFNTKKLVIREIINPKIFACLIEHKAIVKNIAAVIIQKEKEFSLEFLLGLLNSKLMTFFVFEQTPKSSNKSYPSFNSRLLKSIPIKINNQIIRNKIGEIALIIHNLKKDNPQADTSALEREIDLIVYELYGLSEEEIGIVEGS